jgi:hypothetical protein
VRAASGADDAWVDQNKDWVDEVAVEMALKGRPVRRLTVAEKIEAARWLRERGATATELARRLHLSGSAAVEIWARAC